MGGLTKCRDIEEKDELCEEQRVDEEDEDKKGPIRPFLYFGDFMDKKKKILLLTAFFLVLFSVSVRADAASPYDAAWSCELIEGPENTGTGNAITVGPDFNKNISFTQISGTRQIRYCSDASGSFSCEQVVPITSSLVTDLVTTSDGNSHIVYGKTSSSLVGYCNGNSGAWTCETVTTVGGTAVSIVNGSDGNFHIAYIDDGVYLSHCEGTLGNWTCEDIDSTGAPRTYVSIIDFNSSLHIAYNDDIITGNDDLRYCVGDFGSWNCEAVGPETGYSGSGGYADIVAADGNVQIVHSILSDPDLRHCTGSYGNWTCESVGDINGSSASAVSVGDGNVLGIIFSASGTEQYCEGKTGDWKCRTVDTNYTASSSSIAYQSDNNTFHVTYRPSMSADLIYCESLTTTGLDANFTINVYLEDYNPELVNSLLVDLNSTSIHLNPVTSYNWLVNGTSISTDQNVQRSFLTGADYNISLIVSDGTRTSQLDQDLSLNVPEIVVADYNVNSVLSTSPILSVGNISMRCLESSGNDLNYTVFLNDANVYSDTVDNNFALFLSDQNFIDGSNTVDFHCRNTAGILTTESLEFGAFIKNFYFAFDQNGTVLTSAVEYTAGDINSVYVYSFDNNNFLDIYGDAVTSWYASGDENTAIQVRIGYNDVSFPFTSRDFDLDVLDTNSVPVCYSRLQIFYENRFYSSIARDIIVKNANTGCYHIAGTLKTAFSDNLALSGFLVPQSYSLYLVESGVKTLLAIVEGGTAGQINIDALKLKKESSATVTIAGEGATIQKSCGDTLTDCNTFTIIYRNAAANNSKVVTTVLNGSQAQFSYTETSTPDNFSVSFDATDLNFNGQILTLRIVATRQNGDEKTFSVFFTRQGQVGYIDPVMALILSVVIFLGGITIVSTRILFGWFGAMVALLAIAFLSFSVGVWWISFLQAVMLSMLFYIGIGFSRAQSGAV